MDVSWTVRVPSDVASVRLVRRMLLVAANSAGIDPEIGYDLGLAVTEACANVVQHASAARGYRVTAGINDDLCCVDVVDDGQGFGGPHAEQRPEERDDRLAPQPHGPVEVMPVLAENGRGLMLIKALSDRVSITSHPSHGAMIHFERDLRPMANAFSS